MTRLGRRRFLGALAAAATGATAGCLGRPAVVPLSETDSDGLWMDPPNVPADAHTVTTHVVGRPGPDDLIPGESIGVVVANATGSAVDVDVSIERRDLFRWTSLYDGSHALAAPTRVDFLLRDPATYRIRVSTPDVEDEKRVPKSEFDCNEKTFGLVVTDEGIDQTSITQTLACGF